MDFPKERMTTTELKKSGYFSSYQIEQLLHYPKQNYAFRLAPRGKWIWDTVRLQRHLDRHPFGM